MDEILKSFCYSHGFFGLFFFFLKGNYNSKIIIVVPLIKVYHCKSIATYNKAWWKYGNTKQNFVKHREYGKEYIQKHDNLWWTHNLTKYSITITHFYKRFLTLSWQCILKFNGLKPKSNRRAKQHMSGKGTSYHYVYNTNTATKDFNFD